MVVRKVEEIRLSLWLEREMQERFGSKRRAKEEILARYVSLIYMGNGQYGLARGAEYYFGRPLSTFTAEDADKAALLAGTAKSARYYAPNASRPQRVVAAKESNPGAHGGRAVSFLRTAPREPGSARLRRSRQHQDKTIEASAVVENVLEELKSRRPDLGENDLLQGHIQVYSTVDARVQAIVEPGAGARPLCV